MKNIIPASGEVVKLLAAFSAPYKKKIETMTTKKRGSEILACVYSRTNLPDKDKKAQRLRLCGKTMIHAENPAGGDPIPVQSMRCKLRLCPSCAYIRAHNIFQNVYGIIAAPEFSGKQFIFLTLTVRNCRGEKLESEINRVLTAWRKLNANKKNSFKKSFLGTFRALEVTYNKITKTYHPHIHAIAAVEPGYFRKSNKNYINQAKLRELWSKACGLEYLPQCRIERVRNTVKKQVAEVAKYTVKSGDYLNNPKVLEVLDPALKSKMLIAYSGLFKTVKARIALPEDDNLDELPRLTVEELMSNPYIRKIIFEWDMGKYHVSLLQPSGDPAEWLEPGRFAAESLRRQAASWAGSQEGA